MKLLITSSDMAPKHLKITLNVDFSTSFQFLKIVYEMICDKKNRP